MSLHRRNEWSETVGHRRFSLQSISEWCELDGNRQGLPARPAPSAPLPSAVAVSPAEGDDAAYVRVRAPRLARARARRAPLRIALRRAITSNSSSAWPAPSATQVSAESAT